MRRITRALSLVTTMALATQAATLEERVATLEEQNTILTEEVLASQSAGFTKVDPTQSYTGLGAAASKVFYSKNPLSIGGYGEMFYANPDNGDDYADVYRFITYFGYRFTDNIILNVEIEYEHGDTSQGGKVVVEFFHLDFLWKDEINLRVGNLLVPMGLVNLRHEPTLFRTVQRPEVEKYLLPSTWQENGLMAYGTFEDVGITYSAGMVNALNVDSDTTTQAEQSWIRDGRIGSAKDGSFTPAFVGRVDYIGTPGLMLGASLYYGDGSNKKDGTGIDGLTTTIFDLHAAYESGSFSATALYTQTNLDGAQKLGTGAVEKASGYYVNTSYDISSLIGIDMKIPIFAQYQDFNPVESTVDGLNEEKYQTKIATIGFNVFPSSQTVLKFDYAMEDVGGVEQNTLSVGMGFLF